MKIFRHIALLLGLLGLAFGVWRWTGRTNPAGGSQAISDQGPIDLTFLMASDIHLGAYTPWDSQTIEQRNEVMVNRMNTLTGLPFPAILGGQVENPKMLLLAGDLTEKGTAQEWDLFKRIYGPNGLLRIPVFETCGNHDREKDTFVLDRIRERHGAVLYTFDLGGVRFISLGEAPDELGLAFLERSLAAYPKDRPIVIFFHLPLQGPWGEGNWFGQGNYRERLRTVLADHSIAAIFHGHSHFSSIYRWNGIDVYNPGSVKHSQRGFLVVRIQNDRMTVAEWNLDSGSWWWWHQKPLNPSGSSSHEIFEVRNLRDSSIRPYIQFQPR